MLLYIEGWFRHKGFPSLEDSPMIISLISYNILYPTTGSLQQSWHAFSFCSGILLKNSPKGLLWRNQIQSGPKGCSAAAKYTNPTATNQEHLSRSYKIIQRKGKYLQRSIKNWLYSLDICSYQLFICCFDVSVSLSGPPVLI